MCQCRRVGKRGDHWRRIDDSSVHGLRRKAPRLWRAAVRLRGLTARRDRADRAAMPPMNSCDACWHGSSTYPVARPKRSPEFQHIVFFDEIFSRFGKEGAGVVNRVNRGDREHFADQLVNLAKREPVAGDFRREARRLGWRRPLSSTNLRRHSLRGNLIRVPDFLEVVESANYSIERAKIFGVLRLELLPDSRKTMT